MDFLSRKLNSNKLYFLYSLFISVISFVGFMIVLNPYYETNDDTAMALILENVHGASNGFVFFQNILYTKFIQALYAAVPTLKWYTIVQLFFMMVSLISVMYIIYKKQKFLNGSIINLMLAAFVGYEFFHSFQFTKTAALCAATGIIVVFDSFDSEKLIQRVLKILFGVILIEYSACVRFSSLELVAGIMCVIGIVKVVSIIKNKKDVFKQILVYVLVFAIAFIPAFALQYINKSYYHNDDNEYYSEYSHYRAELFDHGWPDYDTFKDVYESMGISEADREFYSTWNLDINVLTLDNIRTLVEVRDANREISVVSLVKTTVKAMLTDLLFWVYLSACLASFLSNKKNWLFIILQLGILLVFQLYLNYDGRFGLNRIDLCFYTSGIISMLYMMGYKEVDKKVLLKNIALALIATVLYGGFFYTRTTHPQKYDESSRSLYDEISQDKEHIYIQLVEAGIQNSKGLSTAFGFFEAAPENYVDNVNFAGGWALVSPFTENKLEKYGIKNLLVDGIDNDKVYYVSFERDEMFIEYLKNHYHKNVKIEIIREISNQKVYRLVSE